MGRVESPPNKPQEPTIAAAAIVGSASKTLGIPMSVVVMDLLEFATHDPTKVVQLLQIEKFRDGSGYSCDLRIASGGFACERRFYFDDVSLSVAVPQLRQMAAGTPGACVIKEEWEDEYLRLESNAMGHVLVSGELFEHGEFEQMLRFAFRTDQTMLSPLARSLQMLQDA
jgi:hypothetical protein